MWKLILQDKYRVTKTIQGWVLINYNLVSEIAKIIEKKSYQMLKIPRFIQMDLIFSWNWEPSQEISISKFRVISFQKKIGVDKKSFFKVGPNWLKFTPLLIKFNQIAFVWTHQD